MFLNPFNKLKHVNNWNPLFIFYLFTAFMIEMLLHMLQLISKSFSYTDML